MESRKLACADYRRQYKLLHPQHEGMIPVMLSADGRWQKRWGWNALDGHVVSNIHPLPEDAKVIELQRNCAGVYVYHRIQPSVEGTWPEENIGCTLVKTPPSNEETKWFLKSAGAMDPQGIYDTVIFLACEGLEVTTFLHDNDIKGIKLCLKAKKDYLQDHPNSGISLEVKELLCGRHGASHAGKYMMQIARDELPKELLKVNGRDYCWLASDKCRRYFSKMFRLIMKSSKDWAEANRKYDGIKRHLCREFLRQMLLSNGIGNAAPATTMKM
jgi:hypothetical protein